MKPSLMERSDLNQDGFSLLELVIAVGILLILSVGGVSAYGSMQDNADDAALDQAAQMVYDAAVAYDVDDNDRTTYKQAKDDYDRSKSKGSDGKSNAGTREITITIDKDETTGVITVTASMGDKSKTIAPSNGTNPGETPDPGDGTTLPPIQDALTSFTLRCDSTTSGLMPVSGLQSGAEVHIQESNSPSTFRKLEQISYLDYVFDLYNKQSPGMFETKEELRDTLNNVYAPSSKGEPYVAYMGNVSEEIALNAGVSYKVTVDGNFNSFTANTLTFGSCLRNVEKIGLNTGVDTLSFGAVIESVPNEIPSTVINLNSAFSGSSFNGSNIADWDTSNVVYMNNLFYGNTAFNQDISSWNTSNVKEMSSMFRNASKFNQDISSWDTSNVTKMDNMFREANNFNQNLSTWNVEKVTTYTRFAIKASGYPVFPSTYLPKFK